MSIQNIFKLFQNFLYKISLATPTWSKEKAGKRPDEFKNKVSILLNNKGRVDKKKIQITQKLNEDIKTMHKKSNNNKR